MALNRKSVTLLSSPEFSITQRRKIVLSGGETSDLSIGGIGYTNQLARGNTARQTLGSAWRERCKLRGRRGQRTEENGDEKDGEGKNVKGDEEALVVV
jgi:hypothetical protein